jgi:hypothetical protein
LSEVTVPFGRLVMPAGHAHLPMLIIALYLLACLALPWSLTPTAATAASY